MLAKSCTARLMTVYLLGVLLAAGCGATSGVKPAAPDAVTLRFAARQSAANYSALADEFHRQHPRVTVQIVSNMAPTVDTLTALNIDVYRDAVTSRPDPKLQAALLPLDEWINADKSFPRADIFSGALAATRSNGMQYGLPAGLSPVVMYYDAARFKAVGAKLPAAGWTLDDFVQAAVSVNQQQSQDVANPDFSYGFCSIPLSTDAIIFTYLFGGQIVDSLQNPTMPTLDAPANLRALEWYAGLRQEYAVTPDPDQLTEAFPTRGVTEASMRSKCGLWLGSYASFNNRTAGMRWQGEPLMLPLPRGQAAFTVASLDSYYILRQTQHPAEAWQWTLFLLNHQEAAGAQVPARRSLIASQEFAGRVAADALGVARNLPDNVIVLSGGMLQDAESVFLVYLQAVDVIVREKADVKSTLAAAQKKAAALFGQ